VTPVKIKGKALVRELSAEQAEWDAPLPALKEEQCRMRTDSLCELEQLQIERPYVPVSLCSTKHRVLRVFSDASTMAISKVAYLKARDKKRHTHIGFYIGKEQLAPHPQHTEQWCFVTTKHNPADHGTHSVPAAMLKDTNWFKGPAFLAKDTAQPEEFELIDPEADVDVRPQIQAIITKAFVGELGSNRLECFSSWRISKSDIQFSFQWSASHRKNRYCCILLIISLFQNQRQLKKSALGPYV